PHGLICARLLPLVCQINIMALRNRAPEEPYLARYTDVARILTDNPKADAMDIVPWLHRLVGDLNVPGLADFNLRADNIPAIVNQAQQASSMRGNPIDLSEAELAAVLKSAM
ncbi:MAG TPA: iron-containing alcohol dehydrogenase, partial [Deltaproteobacteria bacterium]|nr:iron-containing alcohol dehydrogenase [Deltaproteobacteria bacterium]